MYGLNLFLAVFYLGFCNIIQRGHAYCVCNIPSMRKRAFFYSIFAISFFKRRMIFFSKREM